ncbi:DUF2249 domain-containing protein, partial [Acinetobacter baumannii]
MATSPEAWETGGGRELDVREIPPRERHPRIFRVFDDLAPGEG